MSVGQVLDHNIHAALQRPWRSFSYMSRVADRLDLGLGATGYDRGPWIAVAFAGGIGLWFITPSSAWWVTVMAAMLAIVAFAIAGWRKNSRRPELLLAVVAVALAMTSGMAAIWARSELAGAPPIERPMVARFDGRILAIERQPSKERIRLILATRDPKDQLPIRVRVNVPEQQWRAELTEGAHIRLRARLMPPAPPMLPGGYDFARTAWFEGLSASGSVLGPIELITGEQKTTVLARWQRKLSVHVRAQVDGSAGTIAAAFASGDRGAISQADEDAMRDAGLTHLLSISGLHVSALIGAVYFLSLKVLALIPPLALRVRLPLIAAAVGALAGIGYTLLTGAEVPTVRSCLGALLILLAMMLGREPLSLRMVATVAMIVMLLWPHALVGPSFQMSFSAVIAIIALHTAAPVRAFLAIREEPWVKRMGRHALMLFITGLVIELALSPIVLYHFHRTGFYGAFANVIAIPLVTFLSMPLIATALFADIIGLGTPFWWLAGLSLEALLALAHMTASMPGAVKMMPQMSLGTVTLFVAGGLWLALWRGNKRLWGLLPAVVALLLLLNTRVPDVLISGDGRHVGIITAQNDLVTLRDGRSSYARDNLRESAGVLSDPISIKDWEGARCSRDFCIVSIERGGRTWHMLLTRSHQLVSERELQAACERVEVVIADRRLPRSCQPRWLKADKSSLKETGGLALYLSDRSIDSVSNHQGNHGWWDNRRY